MFECFLFPDQISLFALKKIPVHLLRELGHKYLTGRLYFGRILAKTA